MLALPIESVDQIAAEMADEGLVKRVVAREGVGYVLTYAGARHFATKVLGVSAGLLEKTLSATAIEALVAYLWSHARGPALKTILITAFRTDRYPVFKRATKNRLRKVLIDCLT